MQKILSMGEVDASKLKIAVEEILKIAVEEIRSILNSWFNHLGYHLNKHHIFEWKINLICKVSQWIILFHLLTYELICLFYVSTRNSSTWKSEDHSIFFINSTSGLLYSLISYICNHYCYPSIHQFLEVIRGCSCLLHMFLEMVLTQFLIGHASVPAMGLMSSMRSILILSFLHAYFVEKSLVSYDEDAPLSSAVIIIHRAFFLV